MPTEERARHGQPGGIVNAMTVDVEDWFHVHAFASTIGREAWDRLPCRVERNTDLVAALFAEHGVRATFFVLGWVARRHPELVRRLSEAGHEIASHGWDHRAVHAQDPAAFARDVAATRRLLEDLSGREVIGYRAASFSIGERTPWAHAVLQEAGYRYSSSVYPIRHDHYGMAGAPRFAFHPAGAEGIVELPVTTVQAGAQRFPCGGGGYFRLLPYGLSRLALRRVNGADGQPCIFYFHPWEIDPDQPRVRNAPLKSRFRHYCNLGRTETRLRRLLRDFRWGRMDQVFRDQLTRAEAWTA